MVINSKDVKEKIVVSFVVFDFICHNEENDKQEEHFERNEKNKKK